MSRGPDRRQITTNVRSPIHLGMNLEEITASEVQILFDGDLRETREVSPDECEIKVVFTLHNPGEYCIEMVAEEDLSEKMERLQQQDALEISPPKAHAIWDVTVEPRGPQSKIRQLWWIITNLLALREIVSVVQNRWDRVNNHLHWSDSEGEEEEDVNMTLDEFRKD